MPSKPSLLHTLAARELNQSKVLQRPSVADMTADGACPGSGVLVVEPNGVSAPPLAVSFGKLRSHLVAVADEEGFVSIFNTYSKLPSSFESHEKTGNARTELWMAHSNAVFDLCWIKDDRQMLTASGDQTVRLWDIEAKTGIGVMKWHSGSVKSLCGHPFQPEISASGSRDGSVALWDTRGSWSYNSSNERCFIPVATIKDAHLLRNGKRGRGSKVVTKSVTAVLYLKDDRMLATAGAADGIVKFWDTRQLKSPVTEMTVHAKLNSKEVGRVHGISGLSQHASGAYLIASCTDSRIYVYDVYRPEKGSIKSFQGHVLGSFYIKAAFSPDGMHILSGSSDGNVFIWQMGKPEASPVILNGHAGEVTAVDWCPTDFCKIATCSDDFTVRIWNNLNPRFVEPTRLQPSVLRRRITADQRLTEEVDYTSYSSPSCSQGIDAESRHIVTVPNCCKDDDAGSPMVTLKFKADASTDAPTEVANHHSAKSPEASSPSSVLNPPSSLKRRRTIVDYYGL